MDLDLLEVRSFLTLAATGHYGRAAAQLHVSESGLSKRVARLERSLGVGLLERDSQGVACLTTAGRRFRREAETLVDQADVAVATAGGPAGANLVRLGLPGQQSTPRDRAQLHEFQVRVNDEMSRDARVVCVGIPFGATARSLLEGHADVVVDALPAQHPAVCSSRVGTFRRKGILSARHRFADVGPVAWEEFAELPMLYDSSLPPRWMSLWWLGDLRSLPDAHLVQIAPPSQSQIFDRLLLGHEVIVSQVEMLGAMPEALSSVELLGVPERSYYALWRRLDQRRAVGAAVMAVAGALGPTASVDSQHSDLELR
ncbi:MAG: LysR family transcriptional regulator [Friedmanniella sp.]